MRHQKIWLGTAAVAAVLVSAAAAQPGTATRFEDEEEMPEQRFFTSRWSVLLAGNYSDNFARIGEGPYQRVFVRPDGDLVSDTFLFELPNGETELVDIPVSDSIPLETEGKYFSTASLSGVTAFENSRASGIVRGTVTLGVYGSGDSLEDINEDVLFSNLPSRVLGEDAVPTVGEPDFRQTFVNPNLNAFSSIDILDDDLQLQVGGFATQQSFRPGNQLQVRAEGQDINQVIVGGFFVGPVYEHRFQDDQRFTANVTNTSIFVAGNNINDLALGGRRGQQLSNSVSNEITLGYSTGYLFEPFGIEAELFGRDLTEEGEGTRPDQDIRQVSAAVTGSYVLSPNLRLLTTVGYDDLESSFSGGSIDPELNPNAFSDAELSGLFYAAGFRWQPTRDDIFELRLGERFAGFQVLARADLQLTPRLRLDLLADRQVTSGLQNQQAQAQFFNTAALRQIEQLRQSSLQLGAPNSDQILRGQFADFDSVSRVIFGAQPTTNVRASLGANYGRNNFGLTLGALILDDSGSNFGGQFGNRINANVRASRRLSRRLLASANIAYAYTEGEGRQQSIFGPVQFTDITETSFDLSLNYTLSRNWALNAGFLHIDRIPSEEPAVASLLTGTLFEYDINQVRIGARLRF